MDSYLVHVALTVLLIIAAYAILARGLLYASEPFRQKCLELYEKMTKSNRADAECIAGLDEFLDEIYSNRAAWKLAALAVCVVFFVLPVRKLFGRTNPSRYSGVPESLQLDYGRFTSFWMLATVANSPAATMIFATVGLIGIAFFVPLHLIATVISSKGHSFDHRHAH
jgi:hypothetical protein